MRFTIGLPITKTNFLDETLKSIIQQTYSNFEVIIRNNGATKEIKNDIKNVCLPFIEKYNFRYFESDKQLNISLNFNAILNEANGEYFFILSDDDIIHDSYLNEFNNLIVQFPNVDVYHCRVKLINEKGGLIHFSENCPEIESQIDFIFNRITNKRSLFLSDFVVSTKALRDINGFVVLPHGWGMDELTWFKLCKNDIAYTSKVLLNYRVSQINYSNQLTSIKNRLDDVEPSKLQLLNILHNANREYNNIYPSEFLLKTIEQRFIQIRKDILNSYAKSTTLIKFFTFYFKNKKMYNLPFHTFIKICSKKILE